MADFAEPNLKEKAITTSDAEADLSAAASEDFPNQLGIYRLDKVLGRGGMGEVFLAWDERLGRHVAVKRILTKPAPDERARIRFRREARAIARLNHPAIVQIFDLLETDDGDCLVMEYVEGRGLVELITDGGLEVKKVLRIAGEIADGLAEAHGKGLVHRDLKPENVRITDSDRVKILDFGLARLLWDEEEGGERVSQSGALVGTLHAMSPEQASGRAVDHRSDLFALGSLLYEMLTGRAPFRGLNVLDTLRRVTSEQPPPLDELRPDLAPELIELAESLLAKEPKDRPQNARLVADALGRLQHLVTADGSPRQASVPPPTAKALHIDIAGGDIDDLPTGEWPGLAGAVPESSAETAIRTLVLTELVGRSRWLETLGDSRGAELFARYDRTARDLLARRGGYEADKAENFLFLFERPFDAVAFALEFHRRLASLSSEVSGELISVSTDGLADELEASIAIYLGEVRLRHNSPEEVSRGAKALEIEGLSRQSASRLLDLASPRQTLLNGGAFEVARRAAVDEERWDESLRWLAHGNYMVVGAEQPVEVFEVGITDRAPLAPPGDSERVRRVVALSEELVLGWRPAPGQAVPRRPTWRLEQRLGEGGFGEVWLAVHESGEKRVFKFCFDASRLRALKREVTLFRVLKEALGHRDDIARVLDWNFDAAPFFLEVEHTEGGDLATWSEGQGGLDQIPLETRIELVAQVADALAAAHSVGVLHKDVKPENVLITHDVDGRPRARLTDFGVGVLLDRSQLEAQGLPALGFTETVTEASATAGSRRYLAPELLEGKPASMPADLYSLGVVLYQIVIGDFGHALAPGWQRDVSDELLAEDIATLVDGSPSRRTASAGPVAERLRSLEARREQQQARRRADQRRRQWRIAAVVGVIVTSMALMLAVQSTLARRRAEALENRAVAARGDAEDLVAFMLGDLQEELKKIGRLDALDRAGDKALAYFDGLNADELSPTTLSRHARALHQMGDVRMAQGDLDGAFELFQQAVTKTEDLVVRDPDDLQALFELGQGRFWLGNVRYRQRDMQAVLEHWQAYLEIAEELHERRPDHDDYFLEVAYAHNNLGRLFVWLRNKPLSAEHYRRALEISQELVEKDPSRADWRIRLAGAYTRLGQAQESTGELAAAYDQYGQALEITRELHSEEASVEIRRHLATVHAYSGALAMARGNTEAAIEHGTQQLALVEELWGLDPTHLEWTSLLLAAHHSIAHVLGWRGNTESASDHLRRSLDSLEILRHAKDKDIEFRRSASVVRSAEIHLLRGELLDAQAIAEQCLEEDLKSLQTDRLWLQRAELRLLLGQVYDLRGESQRAAAMWQEAFEILRPLDLDSRGPDGLDIWARALLHLGRRDEARPVVHKLLGMGYRHPRFLTLCELRMPHLCTDTKRPTA